MSLAQKLIGAKLCRRFGGEVLSGRIVETEAYLGVIDRAAHSFGGRRTPRTEPMFREPGTAYVYMTYGMHHCFNVVCGAVDEPVAVLVRAVEPVVGADRMRAHRSLTATGKPRRRALEDSDLCSGPARLCQAMRIDRNLTGRDLCVSDDVWIDLRGSEKRGDLANGTRIGVGYAGSWALKPLRWYEIGSRHVSRRDPSAEVRA